MEALLSSRPPQYDGQDHKASWGRPYPMKGQGTLTFNLVRCTPFTISISPAQGPLACSTPGYIALKIGQDEAQFVLCQPDGTEQLLVETNKNTPGFVPEYITSYWYSFDHFNLVVKYGKGYIMEETTLLSYDFLKDAPDPKKVRENMSFIFGPKVEKVVTLYDVAPLPLLKQLYSCLSSSGSGKKLVTELENTHALFTCGTKQKLETVKKIVRASTTSIGETDKNQGDVEVEKKVSFYNFPLVSNMSPIVKDSSEVTLYDLDDNEYTFSASLPTTCIELYSNVKNTDLNWTPVPEKYKLSDAIRYSLNTPGCILHDKVEEKRAEAQFGKGAKNEVYLRVTLGFKRGTSPGIPYVLEIWPKSCGSPIHNHGNTYAVIHVLHGGLDISIFNKDLWRSQEPLKCFPVEKGDVTWISPNWYQTHQLWNHTDDYCATIQCYQYGKDNDVSWPYFDYLSTTEEIDEFLPDSDIKFSEMRRKVMEEYTNHMNAIKDS